MPLTAAHSQTNNTTVRIVSTTAEECHAAGFVTKLLELGYSPVSYDAPGHGDSPGPIGSILDHQRIIRGLEERHGPFEGVIAHALGVPFALYAVREGVADW